MIVSFPARPASTTACGRSAAGDRDVYACQPRVAFQRRSGDGAHLRPFADALDRLDDLDARISLPQDPLESMAAQSPG